MPIPVDVSTAAIRKLRADSRFISLVEEFLIGSDADDAAPLEDRVLGAWAFQGLNEDGRPFRDPEGSGRCVVVLQEWTEWASNSHNTANFPRLQMLVYADSTRDEDGSALAPDAARKCKYVMGALNPIFHIPGNDDHQWPGHYVFSSVRDGGRSIREVPGTQAQTVRGEQNYNLST